MSRIYYNVLNVKQIGWFFTLMCITFLAGSAALATPNKTLVLDKINQSSRDTRHYQLIELPNKMKVLLVSDGKAVKSLASLALPVGSLHDPYNQQGLAHYTEHMVLMGSKKYPLPASFALFLNRHSGSYNASTAAHRTAFYFEVENSALEAALDHLANAIAEPNLNPKFADKERNAVNAEMTMARANDDFRMKQVDAETLNQQHPASQFSGGNLQTLSNKAEKSENSELQTALVNFHARYYSANIMVGVIYSNQPLNKLVTFAEKTFGTIPNHNITVPQLTMPAFTSDNLSQQIAMIPAQPKKRLYLQFAIDNNIAKFANKSDEYIAYLISNRSPNTLFDQLQKSGLIEGIQAGADPIRYGNSGSFGIYVSLTDVGLAQKDKVIAAIFAYLELIKQQGIQDIYYQELKKVLTLDFEYQSLTRDMSYVEYLSDQLLLYPMKNVLDADYITTLLDKNEVKSRLQALTVDNVRVWVIAPNQVTDKVAYFVDAPYQITSISEQQKANWQERQRQFQFSLPSLNPYIADDFSIIKQPEQLKKQQQSKQVAFDGNGNVVHFASEYFADEPKGAIALSLRTNDAILDEKSQIAFNLLDYMVSLNLAQLQFQAGVAGISLTTQNDHGLMISASGFSQHLADMIVAIFDRFRQVNLDEQTLTQAKAWYLQQLNVADNVNAYSLAMQPLQALSQIPYFERQQMRKVLERVTLEDVIHYREKLLSTAVPYMLTLGNLSSQQSQKLYNEIKAKLSDSANYNNQARYLPSQRIVIKQQQSAQITRQAASSDNALLMSYIPVGFDGLSSKMLSYTLYKIISPWFYDQLRSNEQLGYAVFSLPVTIGQSTGLGFLIQSNQYDPNYLLKRYQQFYPIMFEKLQKLTDAEIAQYKKAVIDELLMPPQTLNEEFEHYLLEYKLARYNFNYKQQSAERIKKISKQELLDFYEKAVMKKTGLQLASQVLGSNRADGENEKPKAKPLPVVEGYTNYADASELQNKLLETQ